MGVFFSSVSQSEILLILETRRLRSSFLTAEEGGRARERSLESVWNNGRQLRVVTRATDPGCPKLIVSDYCMQTDIFTGRLHACVLMTLESGLCVARPLLRKGPARLGEKWIRVASQLNQLFHL